MYRPVITLAYVGPKAPPRNLRTRIEEAQSHQPSPPALGAALGRVLVEVVLLGTTGSNYYDAFKQDF